MMLFVKCESSLCNMMDLGVVLMSSNHALQKGIYRYNQGKLHIIFFLFLLVHWHTYCRIHELPGHTKWACENGSDEAVEVGDCF